MQATNTEFLTTSQAAQRLGVTPEWIRQLCNSGRLPAVRVGTGWRVIPRDAVEDYDINRKFEQSCRNAY